MRTRTKWLALLLVGGLCLTPATVRAQDNPGASVRSPEWESPLPLMWGDRDEGLYVSTEFLILQFDNPLRQQALAFRGFIDNFGQLNGDPKSPLITVVDSATGDFINSFHLSPGPAGAFVGSHETALDQHDVGGNKYVPGMRLTIGYRLRDGIALEISYMTTDTVTHSATAGIIPRDQNGNSNFANSFISSPFFNISPQFAGPPADVISNVVPVPVPAGASTVAVPTPLTGIPGVFLPPNEVNELNTLHGLALPAFGIWNAAEEMYLKFSQSLSTWEFNIRMPVYQDDNFRSYSIVGIRQFHIREAFSWRTVDEDIFGNTLPEWSATYNNRIDNDLYGLQCASGNEVYLGAGWALSVEGRVGIFGDASQVKTEIARGDEEFSVHHIRKDTSIVPMFQGAGYLWWYPIEGIQLRAGYEFLGLIGVKRSPHQVDFNAGTLQPEVKDMFFRMSGFTAGISFIF